MSRIHKKIIGIIIAFALFQYNYAQDISSKKVENAKLDAKKEVQTKIKTDSSHSSAKSYPVIGPFRDTLFVIQNKLGSFSASERASAISNRIEKLKTNYDSLSIAETESTVDIVNGENIIMSVTNEDALSNNTTKKVLASQYQQIIKKEIILYKNETSSSALAREIGLSILILLVLGILVYFCNKLFHWTSLKISVQKGKRIKDFKIKNYTLFDSEKFTKVILSVNSILKWITIFLLIYIALPIIFGLFPWTRHYAETLFGYVLTPLKKMVVGLWNYLPNFFTIVVIFLVFRFVIRGLRLLKTEIEEEKLQLTGFYPDWANPTFQILRVLLYAFMFVLIFPYLPGSDSPIFQGVSVFLGFLFTFGSAGSLSNLIAGIVLTYMRLFKIGDRVKIGDIVGDVIEKSILVTRIKTIKNEIISIPNSTVMNSHTINYSNETINGNGLIMHTTVTIGYDVPWKDIHQALLNAANRTNFLLKEPKPFVLQTSLDDFYVSYQINAYTKEPNKQAGIYSDLHQNIQDCCNEMGIEILSPHYRAARDGNMTTIPVNYLDKDYKAPEFNIKINKGE